MIKINKELLNVVSGRAKEAERLRMNFNFHESAEDTLHRMLNALEIGTYIRPHKHENPDKREAFILLRGALLIVEFNDLGKITEHIILDRQKGNYGVEILPKTYHLLIALENNTVIYEVKDGPYDVKSDKCFASWAPEESSGQGTNYLRGILEQLNLHEYDVSGI